ncbi:MAG: hypothetical protein DRO12_04285 [Thermoprotei archaeon]|nr:MAG: hypothetical protein DRO12_04285 [Thermoprotei archaeon]
MSAPPKLDMAAICLRDMTPFFKAIGVNSCFIVRNPEEGLRKLEELLKLEKYGVVFVQSSILKKPSELKIDIAKKLYPLIVVVPGPEELKVFDPKSFYREVVRKYVGFEIHL